MGQLLTPAVGTGALASVTCMFSAVGLASRPQLQRLLEANPWTQDGRLTGVLMYASGACMVCIEGPADEADLARDRFRSLLGPCEVVEVLREPIDRRQHEAWSIAFRLPDGSPQQDEDRVLLQRLSRPGASSPANHLLGAFWSRAAATAQASYAA